MTTPEINYTCLDRFLKYVKYDTQSSENSDTYPSTRKQLELARVLVAELQELGLKDAEMDQWGYVMATVPATVQKKVPTIGLIAHMDTSPDVSGENVNAIIHKNYQGGALVLSGATGIALYADENPELANQHGNDIITSDGNTLLGADNKAGIAEIFDAVHHLMNHPEIHHGRIRLAVTPDEEVGNGTKYFDVKKFDADVAYTVDGETVGDIDNETFSADSVTIKITGVNVHPGYAKGKMINSIKIAAELLSTLPRNSLSPETTEKREGYVHPNTISGGVEETTIKLLIRDFTVEGLKEKEDYLKKLAESVMAKWPKARLDFKIEESYRNMKYELDKAPHVIDYAMQAAQRAGLKPRLNIIRGGTDGSRLSYQGLLTPNIFTGGHNFHARTEWISVQDLQAVVRTIVELVQVWTEKT